MRIREGGGNRPHTSWPPGSDRSLSLLLASSKKKWERVPATGSGNTARITPAQTWDSFPALSLGSHSVMSLHLLECKHDALSHRQGQSVPLEMSLKTPLLRALHLPGYV